jgi:hypothetical protein
VILSALHGIANAAKQKMDRHAALAMTDSELSI